MVFCLDVGHNIRKEKVDGKNERYRSDNIIITSLSALHHAFWMRRTQSVERKVK
jgi:hypothetical protein